MLELLYNGRGVEPWVPTGDVAQVTVASQAILAAISMDAAEVDRRHRLGVRPVTNRRVLELVLAMPAGVAVPLDCFRPADQRLLGAQQAGVVACERGHVQALLQPALSLRSVGVVAATWKQGLRQSSRFAAYCARYVVLDGLLGSDQVDSAAMEARFYGVGLAVHRDRSLDWLVSPAPFPFGRYTAASWLMAEQVAKSYRVTTRP